MEAGGRGGAEMSVLVALLVGAVAALAAAAAFRPVLDRFPAGLLLPMAAGVALAGWTVLEAASPQPGYGRVDRPTVLLGVAGAALLGTIVDLCGPALWHVLVAVGAAIALVVVDSTDQGELDRLIVSVPLVVLAAVLGARQARTPGRLGAAIGLGFAGLVALEGLDRQLEEVAVTSGAVLALVPAELSGRFRLGAAGGSAAGAALALGVILTRGETNRLAALVLVAAALALDATGALDRAVAALPGVRRQH